MSKNLNRGNDAPAAEGNKAARPELEARLQPLDEFRERADSWMKEITAQVARLAGRSEEEERRKKALDKRLADIEERMQSLLTLTEMVSLSKNPFAAPPSEAQPAAPEVPAKAAAPEPLAEPTAPPARSSPAAQDAAPVARDPAPQPARYPVERPSLALSDEDAPAITARPPLHTSQRPVHRAHPNDAGADPAPQRRLAAPREDPRPSAREPGPHAPAENARGRFLVLEWAALIAPSAYRIDLGAFLGFYVESGWIQPNVAAIVRNLALQLRREGGPSDEAPSLEELHARSILIVSQLQGEEAPLDEAQHAFAEARAAASGAWITAKT